MSAVIGGLLILAVFFSGALMMFRTTLFGNVLISSAMKESTRLSGERARTAISIVGTSVEGGCTLRVEVRNIGATSIVEFSRMDVVVQFPGGNNAAQRLQHQSTGPPDLGKWSKTLDPGTDKLDPGIFNPGEAMTITAKPSLAGPGEGTATVGTPNGVIATAAFPAVAPCP